MTQGAAWEPGWKTLLILWGLFRLGGPLSGMAGGDGEMRRKKRRKVPTDGVLQFDLTVKYFPGIVTGGKKNMMEVYYKHCCR